MSATGSEHVRGVHLQSIGMVYLLALSVAVTAYGATIVDDSGTARDGKVGYWSSLVVRNGSAAISYYCEDDHAGPNQDMYALRFAWNNGNGWQWTTVDTNGGSDTSMARGADGQYRIVYQTWSGMGLAIGDSTNWTLSPVPVPADVVPAHISMVLDNGDHPHVVYMNLANGGDRSLRYTYFDGAAWVEGGVNHGIVGTGLWTPTIGFSNTQLAIDTLGTPHIAFAQPSDPINAYGAMKYATLSGGPNGTWQFESLGLLGVDPSLVIGSDGVPRMVFNGDAGIVYAYKSGGNWIFETIVPAQYGSSIALTLSDTNEPFVSFSMTANEDLYLARRAANEWVVSMVDGDGTSDPHVILGRLGTSIDVDETGQPHISYSAIDIYGYSHRADLRYYGSLGPAPCLVINRAPAPQAPCPGGTARFEVIASGDGPLTYQWRRDGVALNDGPTGSGSFIDGAATAVLTIGGVSAADVGSYDCVVTLAGCGSATSTAAAFTVGAAPVIVSDPTPVTACTGATAQFTADVAGSGVIQYQWWKDGVQLADGPTGTGSVITGATTTLLVISNVSAADRGTYECTAFNDCGSDSSSSAVLTVTPCGELRGDMNCDGTVNNFDIDPFVLALSNIEAYEQAFPDCDRESHGDVNDDGVFNNFDIDPFVELLTR